ncbi:MAG: hypothetical protein ACK41W_01750 [Cyanobacteriota bacterium]
MAVATISLSLVIAEGSRSSG